MSAQSDAFELNWSLPSDGASLDAFEGRRCDVRSLAAAQFRAGWNAALDAAISLRIEETDHMDLEGLRAIRLFRQRLAALKEEA